MTTSQVQKQAAISTPFKVLGIVVLALATLVGFFMFSDGIQRSFFSKERVGVIAYVSGPTTPGRNAEVKYSVNSDGQTYQVNGSARSLRSVGDTVTFWAADGDTKGDAQKVFSYDVMTGGFLLLIGLGTPIFLIVKKRLDAKTKK